MEVATEVFSSHNTEKTIDIETLKEVISYLRSELKQHHIKRLQKGKCTIELGFIHSDIITSYKRVADHCSNIAVCIAEVNADEYETHSYIDDMKHNNSEVYKSHYKNVRKKYQLP